MKTEEWEKKIKIIYRILDKIPVFDYLELGMPTYEIMERIEDAYKDNEEVKRELNGYLFNYIATYEFEDYCHNRYGTNFQEISTSYCYWKGEDDNPRQTSF